MTENDPRARLHHYARAMGLSEAQARDVLKTVPLSEGLGPALHALRASATGSDSTPSGGFTRPIKRSSMTYREFARHVHHQEYHQATQPSGRTTTAWSWKSHARRRRAVLLVLLVAAMIFGVAASTQFFSGTGIPGFKVPMIAVFSFLFAWVALNCVTTLFGFLLFLRKNDPLNPANVLLDPQAALSRDRTVAVLLPVYNEDVTQIFAGLQVMWESLDATGQSDQFTFFILSDTQDPDVWVNEEVAWRAFCEKHHAQGRLIYRHRKSRIGRKSGNVADFCRRWGSAFDYMIVLDSDSLLDGKTMLQMATILEARPDIGILQTTPQNFNATTLLARLQQFTSQAYGPIFIMGLHYWQLGDAAYWGHNAIIRVKPFMTYCSLPKPRGRLPLGGMILSHDSIEAALMRRAGWGVWLAYSLEGSFEQPPSTITLELSRDARWCRGNIQHLRYLGLRGLTLGHRWLFLNGNFFYGASFLWMLLLVLVTANSVARNIITPDFFPSKMSLFPEWPVQHREMAFVLLGVTVVYLFLPKCLAVIATASSRVSRQQFGGVGTLVWSALMELIFSSLMAPLRMILHSYHVITSLFGRRFDWHVSSRTSTGITLKEALTLGGFPTAVGVLAAFSIYHFDRTLFWWTSAIFIPLIFSIPFAMGISRGDIGDFFKRCGLFQVPTETAPSSDIVQYHAARREVAREARTRSIDGFVAAVVDPTIHRLHLDILKNKRTFHSAVALRRRGILQTALAWGPQRLTAQNKREVLYDPDLLSRLHQDVWTLPEVDFAKWFNYR